MKLTGSLKVKGTAKQVSDKFLTREFVVTESDNKYPQHISMQLTQDRCALLDSFNVGDVIEVQFNIKGREYTAADNTVKYFTSLEAWSLKLVSQSNVVTSEPHRLSKDTLPF